MLSGDYLPISVATLLPAKAVGLDLFQLEKHSGDLKLYRDASFPLGQNDLDRLRDRGVHLLYIAKDSAERYQAYLRRLLDSSLSNGKPLSQLHVGAMNEVVLDVLRTAFESPDADHAVAVVQELSAITTEIILRDQFAVTDLFRVLHHDYATFTHSANVAFYSAILAAALGFSKTEVELITTGGLLHDLGKLEIDQRILNKPGKLDQGEFREVKKHPTLGFRKLAHRTDVTEGQMMMIYQHHERIDGGGYPVGCVGNDIHPWAKVCAVGDVFEALTSYRPYRKPMTRRKALELQQRDCGTAFDPEMLACWNKIILND